MKTLLMAGVLMFGCVTAKAMTGNELEEFCKDGANAWQQAGCVNFAKGVLEGMWSTNNGWKLFLLMHAEIKGETEFWKDQISVFDRMVCLPDNVTNGQLRKIVAKYLNEKPEELHDPAANLVLSAFKEAFPCPDE